MSARLRLSLVFLVAFGSLGILAGRNLWRPSADNHFVRLADGWLHGRLALDGKPPHRNDWGRVTTLTLRDGRTIRGFPCRTDACREVLRTERAETWRTMQGQWVTIPRRDIEARADTWYVTFPPGPAVVLLPLVVLWGLQVWDVLFTALLGALIPVVLVWFLDDLRGRSHDHVWLATALTLGSPACFAAAHGSVWLTAQTLAILLVLLTVASAWELRRPVWCGICLALLLATRPPAALGAAAFVGLEWWRMGRPLPVLVRGAVPVVLGAALLAWHNYARFEDALEFGHRYLDIAWQPRIQEHGALSTHYLARNLHSMLLLPPRWQDGSLRLSVHGMSLLLACPWILAWALARRPFPQHGALLLGALLAAVPGLLYQNTGQVQVTFRFALDWLPLAVVAMGAGGAMSHPMARAAVVWGVAFNVYGAWWFGRAPGYLFSLGLWPYGSD